MSEKASLYGSGFAYPAQIDEATGGYKVASEVESVKASLTMLFETVPGEVFMNPEYGCALRTLTFEQDTEVFRALAETAIRDAVRRWEPRISEVLKVEVEADEDDEHTLYIRIYFRLIQSPTVHNFVYPFTETM